MEQVGKKNSQASELLYEKLFRAWPLMRRKLLPTGAVQSELGMPFSHVQVLMLLEQNGTASISEISEQFGIAKPNITPMIDRMIEEGLVMRERMNTDRRIVSIVLCEAGQRRLVEIYRVFYNHIFRWVPALSPAEMDELNSALDVIIRLFSAP